MKRLEGKVAVITGGAGAIGQATARLFVQQGAQVLLTDLKESALAQVAEQLGSDQVSYLPADLTLNGEVQHLAQTAQDRYGQVDVLFANAGIEGEVKPIAEYPEEVFDQVLSINVKGVWLCLKHFMPVMGAQAGGSIIITSSIAGLQGTPGVSGYATSKHAVVGLMKVAALEGGSQGIRVNTIHPAPVDNRMMRALEEKFAPGQGEAARAQFTEQIPLQRYATDDDVAQMALFLGSDESKYITGGQFTVDGGMSA